MIFEVTEPNFPQDQAVRIFVQFERTEDATKVRRGADRQQMEAAAALARPKRCLDASADPGVAALSVGGVTVLSVACQLGHI